jgi:YjbE family integral membrane protein
MNNYSTELAALLQVFIIDISLAGDNAIVIGMAARGLPPEHRKRAVLVGLSAATVLRIGLAIFAVRLLDITGLALAGGLLLLWVAWKMFQEIKRAHKTGGGAESNGVLDIGKGAPKKKLSDAILQILIADIGMSLDNVLAVAGAARDHYVVMAIGLLLSIALMGLAATATANLLQRWPWLTWLGLLTVLFVAARMIWDGAEGILNVI